MKIEVIEEYHIKLKDVFNPVLFETEEGEKISVYMRDGGFEIGIKDISAKGGEFYSFYRIIDGNIQPLVGERKIK